MNVHRKFEMRIALTVPNNDWSFGWGCELISTGRRGRRGSRMVSFERALV